MALSARLLSVAVAASLTVGCAAVPPAPAAAPPAQVTAEGLGYFVGDWLAAAVDPGTGEEIRIDYSVEPTLGGAWITGYGESAAIGLKSRDVWGRDPRTGEILRVIFDGSGVYATVRSAGWRGDTLVLEGEVQRKAGALRVRETITRVGPDEFRAVWEALRDGVWTPYSVERLTRRTAA